MPYVAISHNYMLTSTLDQYQPLVVLSQYRTTAIAILQLYYVVVYHNQYYQVVRYCGIPILAIVHVAIYHVAIGISRQSRYRDCRDKTYCSISRHIATVAIKHIAAYRDMSRQSRQTRASIATHRESRQSHRRMAEFCCC